MVSCESYNSPSSPVAQFFNGASRLSQRDIYNEEQTRATDRTGLFICGG